MKIFDFLRLSRLRIFFLFCTLFISLIFCNILIADNFSFSIGSGYDYISTNYFLLTEDTLSISPDSLDELRRSNDASNELLFLGRIKYQQIFSSGVRINIYNRSAISNKLFRNNLELRMDYKILRFSNSFGLLTEKDENSEESTGRDYVFNKTKLSLRPHLGKGIYLRLTDWFEFTKYNNPSQFSYNFNYNRFNIWLEKDFGWSGLIALGYRYDKKNIPDSTVLEYNRNLFQFRAEYTPSYKFSVILDNEYAVKESNKIGDLDDESYDNLEFNLTYRPTFNFTMRFSSHVEYTSYQNQDFVTYNQYYWKCFGEFKYSVSPFLLFSIKSHCRSLSAENDDFSDQDFTQLAIEPGLEFEYGLNLWLDLSYQYGRRNYSADDSEIFSDYTLHSLNIFADAQIYKAWYLNLIAGIDWEKHTEKIDNTTLYLISASIEYKF